MYPMQILHPKGAFKHLSHCHEYRPLNLQQDAHNFRTISDGIFGQKLVRITIRMVLRYDEEWLSIKGGDAEHLEYMDMPQALPIFNTVEPSLQFDRDTD